MSPLALGTVRPIFGVVFGLIFGLIFVFVPIRGTGAGNLASAQVVEASPDTLPPPEVIAAAKRLLSDRWAVPEEALRFEWGRFRMDGPIPEAVESQLLGSGRNGRWLLSVREVGDPATSRSISIPVRAGIVVSRPVARVNLARGQTLSASDIEYQPMIAWGPPDEDPPEPQDGWVAARVIDAGEILSPPVVRPPELVTSGLPVQLVWSSGALEITLSGRAAGSGALGERVFVRTENGHRLAGVVTGPGRVALIESNSRGVK